MLRPLFFSKAKTGLEVVTTYHWATGTATGARWNRFHPMRKGQKSSASQNSIGRPNSNSRPRTKAAEVKMAPTPSTKELRS